MKKFTALEYFFTENDISSAFLSFGKSLVEMPIRTEGCQMSEATQAITELCVANQGEHYILSVSQSFVNLTSAVYVRDVLNVLICTACTDKGLVTVKYVSLSIDDGFCTICCDCTGRFRVHFQVSCFKTPTHLECLRYDLSLCIYQTAFQKNKPQHKSVELTHERQAVVT